MPLAQQEIGAQADFAEPRFQSARAQQFLGELRLNGIAAQFAGRLQAPPLREFQRVADGRHRLADEMNGNVSRTAEPPWFSG